MYDTDCIGEMKRDFLQVLEVSQPVTAETATLRGVRRLVAEVLKVVSPLL